MKFAYFNLFAPLRNHVPSSQSKQGDYRERGLLHGWNWNMLKILNQSSQPFIGAFFTEEDSKTQTI